MKDRIKDVEYLKSRNFNSLLQASDNVDDQPSSEIPPITTKMCRGMMWQFMNHIKRRTRRR